MNTCQSATLKKPEWTMNPKWESKQNYTKTRRLTKKGMWSRGCSASSKGTDGHLGIALKDVDMYWTYWKWLIFPIYKNFQCIFVRFNSFQCYSDDRQCPSNLPLDAYHFTPYFLFAYFFELHLNVKHSTNFSHDHSRRFNYYLFNFYIYLNTLGYILKIY